MRKDIYQRIVIENVYPELDGGRFPVKRIVGDRLEVWCDILMDGHDKLQAVLAYASPGETNFQEVPLEHQGNDRYTASIHLEEMGRYRFRILAWPDMVRSWQADTKKKLKAGQDVSLDYIEGLALIDHLFGKVTGGARKKALQQIQEMPEEALLDENVAALVEEHTKRHGVVTYQHTLEVVVDPKLAEFSAWYEMVPRSQGEIEGQSGTFADCEKRLQDIQKMGFDVIYFTPIHPIGFSQRKGKNNSVQAGEGDPGSFYAIGSDEGGHTSIHPELGTLADFRHFVKAANDHGMQVALDFAIQCSPDHPWIKKHPEWFNFRADGSIKHAENPPKKYEDIVNVNFQSPAAESLWEALRNIIKFWIEQGVTIFRVDNPHTKPFVFWEWLITSIKKDHPEIIFLSEAFTRPKIMYHLAKLGFTQSYSYFSWRNTKAELTEYLTELTTDWPKEYFRPNFFPVTPDIFPTYLHDSGKPGFIIRLTLAATLSSNYGMLNGYELCEGERLAEGKEEYLNSEKYEYKVRDWNAPGNIKEFVTKLNQIRRDNPALQKFKNLHFYPSSNPQVIFYCKRYENNIVFIAVNLEPHQVQETHIDIPLATLGLAHSYVLDDLLLGHSWQWHGERQHLRLDPEVNPVAIFGISYE